MSPIIQEHISKIDIVISRGRAVDDNTTENAFPGLERKVGVVPAVLGQCMYKIIRGDLNLRGTILGSSPGVSVGLSRGNWTLSNGRDTIVLVGEVLSNTVEMQSGAIVCKAIGKMNNYYKR